VDAPDFIKGMNRLYTARKAKGVRWWAGAGLAAFAILLLVGTMFCPHFWLTADQRGDLLLRKKAFAEAAKTYTDPWRVGTAQYRNGDFEAAAKSFARVPGASGAFGEGNAQLMHGQYDQAISSYDRALGLRPGWKEAEENKALAGARKAKLNASAQGREQEQTDAYTPDKVVLDQKGGEKEESPMDLSAERMSDEAMRAAWLRRVQTSPSDFLRAKFAYQVAHAAERDSDRGVGRK
jgi:Ca-activated chloride channel family protein